MAAYPLVHRSGTSGGRSGPQRGGPGGGRGQQQQRRSETQTPQQLREWLVQRGAGEGSETCPYVIRTGARAGKTCGRFHTERRCFARLDNAWRTEFGDDVERPRWAELLRSGVAIFDLDFDVIISAMYALSFSAEGNCYRCVPPDPGIAAAALGASASGTPPCTAPAEALHTFTLDSGASRCFFRDNTTLTPLPAPVPVRLADPSGGPVVASSSTVLPCPAVPSGSLSGLHLPSFSTNLVSTTALQDAMVTTTTPGGQRLSICTCTRTGHRLATFTRQPGSSLYTLATEPPQVAASAQVSASGQVAASCSCRLLSHQTLLWHHRLGHPSLPRLRGMHSRLLVSGLPRSLTPLPPSLAPPCLPCVEGRQRAAPHSSSFPPTTAPLQTLHMDVWGPARISGQGRERYFLLVVDDYTRYTTVFPLRSKGEVSTVLIPWIRTVRLQLRERFGQDLPVLRLHSDRGGEFSSDLLRDFSRGEGITQSFTLPDSPQKNGIAERRIGLVMEVARTSMIHAAAPHFLWPFAVRYAAHQLNLWPRVSFPETSPTLRWTGKVGDASVFRFYHPTSRRVLPSQDVTFDESVPFYRLFPYRSAPSPPPPLFLAPGPPPVDPLPPQGPAPSGVSQVDPLPGTAPVQVAVVSGAAPGAASRGAASGGAEPGGAGSEGAGSGGAEPEGVELGGAESVGAEPEGAESEGAESGGAEPRGAASSGGPAGASPRLSSQQLREWLVQRAHRRSVAPGAGEPGGARAGGATATTGVGVPTEPGAAGAGGAGDGVAGVGVPGAGGAGAAGAGAVDPSAGGAGGTVRPRPYFVPLLQQVLGVPSSTGLPPPFLCPPPDQSQPLLLPASPLPVPSPYTKQSGGLTERRESASRPVSPVRPARRAPRSHPPPVPGTHTMTLHPSSVPLRVPLSAPPESSLPAVPDPESDRARAASPTVARLLATAVTDPSFESAAASALVAELLDFAAACRLDYASALVAESVPASPPSVGGECALGTDVLEDRQEDFECLAAALPRFASLLLPPEGDPDAPDIPTSRSYAEAITGTYVDEVPPPGVNIVDGMWIFRVKRPPGSPPAFKARYVARGFSQRQGVDYFQTFSPTPKMTTLWGSLHEEIWLRRPSGFTGSFPTGTQWSLRRPVYGLRQAPREWHDTLRTTLAALGFVPSTADPSLFLRTETSLPPFYVLVYVDDLVFATADTEALTLVKSELQKRHTCTELGELRSYLGLQITRDRARRTITLTQSHMVHQVLQRFGFQYSSPQLTPLSTSHSLSTPPSDESVEPTGPYPELVGCLMYLMTCTRPDLAYPLSLLARYVAPGGHRKVHWDAAKRVLRYLCSTSGMGLVLGGRGPVVLTGHADASWVDDSATQQSSQGYTYSLGSGSVSWRSTCSSSVLSSSCEAEIYAGAMAAQELRWLTYLLTDLGEQPRSPPVLYVDLKAVIALCQEHRLEHRIKHITLRYFLARELQQRGQLRLAYLNLWPRVSLPETSPTLRWTGKVGDASVFRVWGSCAFVPDTSADKLSARAIFGVFLGFVPDAPGWQFYHPTSRRVLPSQDVTFDESVPFYHLFPYCFAPHPPPPLFLAPGPPPVDPLPPQGPAPSGVSQVDPLPGPAPVQVAVVSGAAPRTASGGAEPGGAGSEGAGSGGAEPEGVEPGGAESEGVEPGGAESEGAESGGAEPRGAALSGAPGAGKPGDTGAGGAAITAGAGDPTEPRAARAGGAGAARAGAVDPGARGAGGTVRPRLYFVPLLQQVLGVPSSTGLPPPFQCPRPDQSQPPLQPASPLPVPSPYTKQSGGLTECREPASRPVSPVRTARRAPRLRPPPIPGTHTMALRSSSVPLRVPLPAPPESSLHEVPDPESDRARAASPTVARLLATAVTDPSFESAAASALIAELLDFAAACRLDYASALVAESVPTSPPSVVGECALGTDVLEDRQEDFECLAAVVPRFASLLLAPEGDPDAPDIPTPRSYAEAITGPYSSQWQAAMDAEMASWKSTGTYVDNVPPPGANIIDGM
ncbi:unnamed protein product [Closterium sp. NIES-54]